MSDEPKRRVSITRLQRQTVAGADLLALCQTVTEDGSLADDEVAALRQWLVDNGEIDLPAKDFLWQTVERIVADGKVTSDERRELCQSIEAVLPPEIRDLVRSKRKAAEQKAIELLRAEGEAVRAAEGQARLRNRPVGNWDFMVAGARYEGRPQVIERHADRDAPVFLARDPSNRYSRHAVQVRLRNGMQIGFVPEEDAVDMAPLLDAGHPHEAHIKKILTGGRSPIPVVVARMYSRDTDRRDVVYKNQVPTRVTPPKRVGCGTVIAAFAMLLGMIVVETWWR